MLGSPQLPQQPPSYPSYPSIEQPDYIRPSHSSGGSAQALQPLYQPYAQPQQQQHHLPQQQQQPQQHQHHQQQKHYTLPSSSPDRIQPQQQQVSPLPQARPLGSYPTVESGATGRDPAQSLLDAYPNPQTDNQKIVKMLEVIAAHMQEQYRRYDSFMSNVEARLGGLEAAMSQLVLNDPELAKRAEALSQRERMERERERDRSAGRLGPSLYAAPSSPRPAKSDSLKKKKKKKTIVPEYERELSRSAAPDLGHYRNPAVDEVDEELARKLQAQFNAEAEIDALKKESITLSDEEYAQKLQGLYLKRDAAAGQAGKRTTPTPTPTTTATTGGGSAKKDAAAKKSDPSARPEEKSLWSRLFGVPKSDSDEESDEEDVKTGKKTEVTTTYPVATTVRSAAAQPAPASAAAASQGQQQQVMAMPYYYPGMPPQQQFVIPQGMPQYAPYPMAMQPGAQYLYPAAVQAAPQ
jgi:hypothetical protein